MYGEDRKCFNSSVERGTLILEFVRFLVCLSIYYHCNCSDHERSTLLCTQLLVRMVLVEYVPTSWISIAGHGESKAPTLNSLNKGQAATPYMFSHEK